MQRKLLQRFNLSAYDLLRRQQWNILVAANYMLYSIVSTVTVSERGLSFTKDQPLFIDLIELAEGLTTKNMKKRVNVQRESTCLCHVEKPIF